MATTTVGWHRISNVVTRSNFGAEQVVVPGATIYVTLTSSGAAATIYSDPSLSVAIHGSVVTADVNGNYDYYIPLNYNVTESISSANGSLLTISNLAQNGPLVTTLTTTSASSDTVTLAGTKTTSHVAITATNSAAAAMIASVYVTKTTGSITVYHPVSSGATFDIIVTPY